MTATVATTIGTVAITVGTIGDMDRRTIATIVTTATAAKVQARARAKADGIETSCHSKTDLIRDADPLVLHRELWARLKALNRRSPSLDLRGIHRVRTVHVN